ncbi:sugar transferase [Chamaesiphon sp.]|uniref:sugar transferase n=1 Tax=Chamaesiphon sp. TaxID=2814140 RepID=UPI003593774F
MTDLNKPDLTDRLWQTKDIRATTQPLWSRVPIFGLQLIALVSLDTLMLCASWAVAEQIGKPIVGVNTSNSIIPILAVSIGTLAASGLYGTDDKLNRFGKLFKSLALAQIIVLVAAFFYQPGLTWVSRSVFSIALVLNFIFTSSARFLFELCITNIRKHNPIFQQAIVLLGNQADIEHVRKLLKRSQQFKVDSTIDLAIWDMQSQLEQIIERIRLRRVSEVFICSEHSIDNQIVLFWNLKAAGIHLRIIPTELQLPQRSAEIKMIEEIPTVRFKSLAIFSVSFLLKRLLDIIAALIISILVSPLLLIIAIAIAKTSSGPIFYKQQRVGLKGQNFYMWKFRTMIENASELQQQLEAQNEVKGGVLFKIKDDPRITKVGKFLRKYSLDELPQLINVLKGQMSLVGPRPLSLRDYELSIENIEEFSRDRFLRYQVLPGVTGLWQVKGRASIDSAEIFYWDTIYVFQWSLALDLKILLETIKVVLFREGSY